MKQVTIKCGNAATPIFVKPAITCPNNAVVIVQADNESVGDQIYIPRANVAALIAALASYLATTN